MSHPLTQPGGISTFTRGLLEALTRRYSVESVVIAPPAARGLPGRRFSQLVLAGQQLAALARIRPDIVQVHEHTASLGAAVLYRVLLHRTARVVYTVHVDPVVRLAAWKRRVLGWLLDRCTAVTAVSHDTARALTNIAAPPPANVTVIHGAARVTARRPDDPLVCAFRARYRLGTGPVLCQVGPLNFSEKVAGIERLIEALATVRARYPTTQLLIVGDGALRGQVEATIARCQQEGAAIVTGYLHDVTLPLAVTDVYCQITLRDACPVSLLEAMHCGKPVVAARTGGIPELVTDGEDGLLVDVEPSAIAAGILRLLDAPDLAARLGARAAETARARFTWERVADDYARVYGLAPTPLVIPAGSG